MGKLDGKVAIITGSTSGMGRETAYLFAKEGAKVVVTGRNAERAQAVVDKIKAEGGEAIYVIADASESTFAQTVFDKTMEAYGTVDILMNNAGMLSLAQFATITEKEFMDDIYINVTSALMLSQKVAPVMQAKGDGHIINVASNAAFIVNKTQAMSPYSCSKAAVVHFTHCMAVELGKHNIRVNAICPGFTNTDLSQFIPKDMFDYINNQMPLGRFGEPIEVGALAVYFASPAAAQVTGTAQVIDGGYILSC